ncbi:MAG TPA: hypothetical protein PKV48_03720 [Thermodesulfobacteriota bacterium]|nr:hypothetical protein [Thermodesulfobacteriota bacterium]
MEEPTDFFEKHRPKRYSKILGNDLPIAYYRNVTISGLPPRSSLFYGDGGLGKTITSLVYAKGITCLNFDGDVCGKCGPCLAMEKNYPGNYLGNDIYYYNCTLTSEATIEDLLQHRIHFRSSNKIKKSIHIFDEFHRTKPSTRDKFLRPLETSQHALFIFCLIDISSIESAFLQRVTRWKFIRPKINEIIPWLLRLCTEEGIVVQDNDALKYLAELADRIPRECLNLLQKIARFREPLTAELVQKLSTDLRPVTIDDESYEVLEDDEN